MSSVMLSKSAPIIISGIRNFSSSKSLAKQVAVLGAAGGIGQPLSLLLKMNPLVTKLHLYDLFNAEGLAMDLQHCGSAKAEVKGFAGTKLKEALEGSDLVVIPAGVPPKADLSSEDLFNVNASIVSNLARQVAQSCPSAMVAVISNPINSMVPVVAETMKQYKVYNPRKLVGVTTLNLERANYMIGKATNQDPSTVACPVIGGHAGHTIIPLFSRCKAAQGLSETQQQEITQLIREGNDNVQAAKRGTAGPTLSMAHAAGRFCQSVLLALGGHKNLVECAYVQTDIFPDDERNIAQVTDTEYFVTPVVLGKDGVMKNLGVGNLSGYEQSLLPAAVRELQFDIKRGKEYVKNAASGVDNKLKEEMEKRN